MSCTELPTELKSDRDIWAPLAMCVSKKGCAAQARSEKGCSGADSRPISAAARLSPAARPDRPPQVARLGTLIQDAGTRIQYSVYGTRIQGRTAVPSARPKRARLGVGQSKDTVSKDTLRYGIKRYL